MPDGGGLDMVRVDRLGALSDAVPVARLDGARLEEADEVYRTAFRPGRLPG